MLVIAVPVVLLLRLKNLTSLKTKLEIEIDLSNYVDNSTNNEDFYKGISTVQELIKYYKDQYYDDFEEDETFKQCIEQINKGNKIFFLKCQSYSEDKVEEFLCEQGINNIQNKDIIIISREGGY